MKFIFGDKKITELSLKLHETISRKGVKEYFQQLLNSLPKSIKM